MYFSRYRVKLVRGIVCLSGPCKSVIVTFTLSRPLAAPWATIWNDSYSPRAAKRLTSVLAPGASDIPTRCKLGATHTTGLPCAVDSVENAAEHTKNTGNNVLLLMVMLLYLSKNSPARSDWPRRETPL